MEASRSVIGVLTLLCLLWTQSSGEAAADIQGLLAMLSNTNNLNTPTCGVSKERLAKRIVGGQETTLEHNPWLVQIHVVGSLDFQHGSRFVDNHNCGATIVSDRWLLTAAHCLYYPHSYFTMDRLPDSVLKFVVGLDYLHDRSNRSHVRDHPLHSIKAAFVHPLYEKEDTSSKYDIALLELSTPLEDLKKGGRLAEVCLPDKDAVFDDRKGCVVSGWGRLGYRRYKSSEVVMEVEVDVHSRASCRKWIDAQHYRRYNGVKYNWYGDCREEGDCDNLLCAGDVAGGRGACMGDSGGPLICPLPSGQWVQAGVVSHGIRCDGKYGIFTSVAKFRDWIDSVMGGRIADFVDCFDNTGREGNKAYSGRRSVTRTGKTCKMWNGRSGMSGHNYCRSPGGVDRPWCYVAETGRRYEFCDLTDLPPCADPGPQ